ncbi:MAG TPA: inositol monophosphatase family protein, partial [Gemmatimonadaceae bacterium]|nr:inositol monophosphatase family protein [Gemmatimonadaceae bacterium]
LADPPPPSWSGTGVDIRFVGEETSPDEAHGPGITYVVDPLDGTANFLHGYPWYAVSIAALVDGELVAGVVHNVATGDVFSAFHGGGARLNDRRIHVSSIDDPARALIGTGLPFKYHEHVEPYMRSLPRLLRSTAGIRRAGSASLDLCDVACGRFEAFWELRLSPWDVAAGMLIVREAGGLVTDLDGRDAEVALGPVVAGNPAMHEWLLDVLRDEGTTL